MAWDYANEFSEIIEVCGRSEEMRLGLTAVVQTHAMGSKAVEGGDREKRFHRILIALINSEIKFEVAFERTLIELDPRDSIYRSSKSIFCKGWNERLVITALSRRYCQTVLEKLRKEKIKRCFVPRPKSQNGFSSKPRRCSDCAAMEGKPHLVSDLYERLMDRENHRNERSVPMHPYCRHVVAPIPAF